MKTSRRRSPAAYSAAALRAAFLCFCQAVAAQAPALPGATGWTRMPASLLPMRLPVSDAPAWSLQGSAADFEALDATPVRDLSGDWNRYTPRDGHNAALQSARIELAASREHWEIAATLRADIMITGSRSSWDAVHVYKQRQTPVDGSEFGVQARESGVIWAGVRGAHTWVLRPGSEQGLQLTGALTLLSVRRVMQVDANGAVQFSTAGGYGFQVEAQRQDSYRQFGGYGQQGAIGSGYSADLGLLWQLSETSFVNLSAMDLMSRIRVNSVSTQQATLSSSTNSVDGNGYLNYQPLVVGRYSSAAVNTTLSRKWSISAGTRIAWSDGDVLAGGRWERVGGVDLPALWAVAPIAPGLLLQIDGEFRFRSIGLGLTGRYGTLMLRTRSLPVGQSQALGWQVSFNLPL